MRKLSSTLLLLLSAFFVLFTAGSARANRAAAGEIAYKWVSDSTYLITYTLYRDCGGATAEPTSVNMCYYNTCNTDRGNVLLSKKTPLSSNGTIVSNTCAGTVATTCSSPAGTLKGFRKWVYEGTVTLPSKCASWHFVVSISSRNAGTTNYTVPAANDRMFSEATLNNIDAPTSSSPTFSADLIQYSCGGQKQSYNYGGVDADGDVLSYSLIDPASAADNQTTCTFPPAPTSLVFSGAPFVGGTSLTTNPFGTVGSSSFGLNASTGSMVFTPILAPAQQALLTMLITKRRGTKIVGTVTRDMEFIISTGCASPNANFAINTGASTGILYTAPNIAQVCPNVAHRICFGISSPDATVTITNVTDNHLTFSPTSGSSTITPAGYAGVGTNNVTACFDWTPNETDEGIKNLIIRSEVCKPGTPKIFRLDTIVIDIVRTAKAVAADTFICFGDSGYVCGTPIGLSPYTYDWCTTTSGTGTCLTALGVVSPTDSCTKVMPSATTTYLFTTAAIPAICKRTDLPALNTNQAEVKIVVVNPKIDAGPDTVMCSYSQLQLNANLLNPQPELTYSYKWTPGKWLSDSTSATPLLKFPIGTSVTDIPDSIVFYLQCTPFPGPECAKVDTMKVHILKGFYILTGDQLGGFTGLGHQGRQRGFSDTAICLGKSVTIVGWGDQRYNYIWNPATGVSTPSAFLPGLTITPTATTTYSLTASRAGCPDSTKNVKIIVDPVPTADIGPDQTICFGDTLNLYATIGPDDPEQFELKYPGRKYSYNWSPGGALARADTFFTFFTGYRTEKIVFTVKTPAGCTGQDSAVYTVQPRFFLTTSADTAICPGDTAQLTVAGDALLKTITWKPLTDIDSIHALRPKVHPYFTTDYVVIGVDSNQCVDSASIKVTVFPRTVLYLPDTAVIYPGDVYKLDPQGNSLFYRWFPLTGFTDLKDSASSTPTVAPLLNTMYTVKGTSDAGCIVTDSIFVLVAPDSYIDVPNAFVPGRGNENNVFKPVHLGKATLKSFSVYNRWGVKMFEATDMDKGWDGTYGGQPQPMGVYVYVLEAVTAAGKTITKQGNVTLIR